MMKALLPGVCLCLLLICGCFDILRKQIDQTNPNSETVGQAVAEQVKETSTYLPFPINIVVGGAALALAVASMPRKK